MANNYSAAGIRVILWLWTRNHAEYRRQTWPALTSAAMTGAVTTELLGSTIAACPAALRGDLWILRWLLRRTADRLLPRPKGKGQTAPAKAAGPRA